MDESTDRLKVSDYLAGFADGEGSFIVYTGWSKHKRYEKVTVLFSVTQRLDRVWLLEALQCIFGGSVHHRPSRGGANPGSMWMVRSRPGLRALLQYFDAHLPILKAEEYSVWRAATVLYCDHPAGTRIPRQNMELFRRYGQRLRAIREYAYVAGSCAEFEDEIPEALLLFDDENEQG